MDTAALVTRYLAELPPEVYGGLIPWHLTVLLAVLGLLAGVGLHHLVGHTFRFYRVKTGASLWLALPTGLVLLVSLEVLLAAYVVGTGAERLWGLGVAANRPDVLQASMGALLLEPVFLRDDLRTTARETGLTGRALGEALRAMPSDSLRQGYLDRLAAAGARPASLQTGGETAATSGAALQVLQQVALRWLGDADQSWPSALSPHSALPGEGAREEPAPPLPGAEEAPFQLPLFLQRLVGDIRPETELSRPDWEHVAGTAFTGGVLQPRVTAWTAYLMIAAAALILAGNAVYFYLALALRRWLQRRAAPPPAV